MGDMVGTLAELKVENIHCSLLLRVLFIIEAVSSVT